MLLKKSSRRGFSLVELMLVTALAPIIFFAVFSNFVTGVRLWQRLQVDSPEENSVIFVVKAQKDFENAMRSVPFPFTGSQEELAFLTGIHAEPALGGERAIGEVHYFYDPSLRAILREEKNYSEIYRETDGRRSVVLKGVQSFEISYYSIDQDRKYVWSEDYKPPKPGDLPLAVKLSYRFNPSDPAVEHTFFIPTGSLTAAGAAQ